MCERTGGTWWSEKTHGRVEIQRVRKHEMFHKLTNCISYVFCNVLVLSSVIFFIV